MKIAIIGSRTITVNNLESYLPNNITTIITGVAVGVDTSARNYARANGIRLVEQFPDYKSYGREAPLIRNVDIIAEADIIFAFWDGKSRGTKYTINKAKELHKDVKIFVKNAY